MQRKVKISRRNKNCRSVKIASGRSRARAKGFRPNSTCARSHPLLSRSDALQTEQAAGLGVLWPTLHTVFTLACQYRLKLLLAVQVWAWPCVASILGVPV
eukprot:303345-Prymnesium_polylepis.1